MSRRYWRSIIAAGGLVIVLVVSPALGQADKPKDASVESKATSQQSESQRPNPSPKKESEASGYYEALCDSAANTTERDLCQQWRMAEATEHQVEWSRRQFWATAAEILALVVTISVTGIATWAAVRAASAAEKHLVASERPWISVEPKINGPMSLEEGAIFLGVRFRLKNVGKAPAVQVQIEANIFAGEPDMPEELQRLKELSVQHGLGALGQTLFPGESLLHRDYLVISRDAIEAELARRSSAAPNDIFPVLIGCLTYRTPIDNDLHRTTFAFHLKRSDPEEGIPWMGFDSSRDELIPEVQLSFERSLWSGHID